MVDVDQAVDALRDTARRAFLRRHCCPFGRLLGLRDSAMVERIVEMAQTKVRVVMKIDIEYCGQ